MSRPKSYRLSHSRTENNTSSSDDDDDDDDYDDDDDEHTEHTNRNIRPWRSRI